MCITNIYWGDRVASRLQMHTSFSAVILLVGAVRWVFSCESHPVPLHMREAQIPQTQQLTPEQSRWMNNTTGESRAEKYLSFGVNCSLKMQYIFNLKQWEYTVKYFLFSCC